MRMINSKIPTNFFICLDRKSILQPLDSRVHFDSVGVKKRKKGSLWFSRLIFVKFSGRMRTYTEKIYKMKKNQTKRMNFLVGIKLRRRLEKIRLNFTHAWSRLLGCWPLILFPSSSKPFGARKSFFWASRDPARMTNEAATFMIFEISQFKIAMEKMERSWFFGRRNLTIWW